MSKLFTPVRAGALSLGHRIVMAPLTRMHAGPGDRPSALMEEYYTQRASEGGLIISEATPISRQGYGYARAPGIYDDAQIDGWRAITDAVHARGGQIALQLWHVGRQSHPNIQPGSGAPVAPSAVQGDGHGYSADGEVPFSMPRALERAEIAGVIAEFGAGAARAKAAGFNGVEIHGANGYLPDQFLQDGTNKRTDDYGGPVENRARFLLEVTQAATDVWGADRVGVRLSPSGTYGSMSDSDPQATFGYSAAREAQRAVADALPLLKEAGKVTLAEIAAQEDAANARERLAAVAAWLVLHGVEAETMVETRHGSDGVGLARLARDRHADLIVAGAYGHSRVREWVLGGVTCDLLLDPPCLALLSH